MKILVTGATGFIGRHVIAGLLRDYPGCELTALVRDVERARRLGWPDVVRLVPADISADPKNLPAFSLPDTVIHLAWDGLPDYAGSFHFEKNLWESYRFLKHMALAGVRRFFVAGTCFEYGMREGALTVDAEPVAPLTSYGFAKRTLHEMLLRLFATMPDVSLCWGRIFYLYGEGQNERAFVSLLKKAIARGDSIFHMSGGEQLRDYSAIEEIAGKICRLACRTHICGTFNLCSGQPMSLRRLAEDIVQRSASPITLDRGYYPYTTYEPFAFWGVDNFPAVEVNEPR